MKLLLLTNALVFLTATSNAFVSVSTKNCFSSEYSHGSSPLIRTKFSSHNKSPTCLFAEKNQNGMATLHFAGSETFQSDPVPLQSYSTLKSFFSKEEVQSMLLSGNGDGDVPPKSLSKEESKSYKDQWTEQARKVGGEDPDPDNGDIVYKVNTGGINFAGLKVKSEAIIGVKLVKSNGDGENDMVLPQYELVLIGDQRNVKGPKVLVWIFNKLTGQGSNKSESDEKKDQSVQSLSKFYAKVESDDKGESCVTFSIDSSLDISVKFPSLLLKILPVSKEKAEEQGSASVKKVLMKDTSASLRRIADFYTS